MSRKSYTRYPGLTDLAKANGIGKMTAYQRAARGWSIEHAGSVPVGQPCPGFVKKRPGRKPMLLAEPPPATAPRLFAWERPEWNAKARAEVPTRFVAPPVEKRILTPRDPMVRRPSVVKTRKRYVRRIAEDTAPLHIQRIRTAYCDGFIKTGVLDEALGSQLRDYANECRSVSKHPVRVSAEHETRRYGAEANRARDFGGGSAVSVDDETVARVADFLRAP